MAKNKPQRSLSYVVESQEETEKMNVDKFSSAQSLIQEQSKKKITSQGRISPQLSCTVLPEDKAALNDLTIFAINKTGKVLNNSEIIRALIRLGTKRKDELEF